MAKKFNNNANNANNMKLYISTAATAINDAVCDALTEAYTEGKRIVYVSASLRMSHVFNRIGKALFDYDESACKLGSVTLTHADNGFSAKKLAAKYPDADMLVIDDMSCTGGYPFGLGEELDALKKFAGDGKSVLAGVVMSRKKDLASGLIAFVEGYAKKQGIPYEEVKRAGDDGAEEAPAEPEKKEGENQ